MIIFTLINGVGFGWAKPVQVDSGYYKNPARDGLLVALAGPLANLVLALFFAFMLRFVFLHNFVYFDRRFLDLLLLFLSMGFKLNISLAVFNLLPVPPLDGSKILCFYLRGKSTAFYTGLENYGFLLLIFVIMIFSEPLSSLIVFIINHLLRLIVGI